jgi:hypothetical protein
MSTQDYTQGMEEIFLMIELNFLIKNVNKAEETFAISDVKV